MGNENQLSRYGGFTKTVPVMSPSAKVFFVGAATLPSYADFANAFPVDAQGGNRVFPTLAAMIADSNVVTARGDVILVLPGHTETISSATALTISKAGLYILGLGSGSLRPTITLDTATTATINVSGANVTFDNFIFVANYAAIASLFTLTTAKDFALLNCEFRDTSAILNFVAIVTTAATSNAADGLRIEKSRRIGAGADTNTTIISMLGTNDRVYVKGNYFAHKAVTDGLLMIIATGKVVTNAEIFDNRCNFVGASTSTGGILITTNGSTNSGYIDGNRVQSLDATSPILVTASSGFVFGLNYYTHTADKSGYLVPAADS